jgi:hypothetical protein
MASSIKTTNNMNRWGRKFQSSNREGNLADDEIFQSQWEELVIRFDKDRGEYTVHTTVDDCESDRTTDSNSGLR